VSCYIRCKQIRYLGDSYWLYCVHFVLFCYLFTYLLSQLVHLLFSWCFLLYFLCLVVLLTFSDIAKRIFIMRLERSRVNTQIACLRTNSVSMCVSIVVRALRCRLSGYEFCSHWLVLDKPPMHVVASLSLSSVCWNVRGARWQWGFKAVKLTVDPVSQWPCVTDLVVHHIIFALRGLMQWAGALLYGLWHLYFCK